MNDFMYSVIVGIIIYFSYYFVIIKNDKRLKKYINYSRETKMIKAKFNLNYDKLNQKMVVNYFAIVNSFMIGLLFFIVTFVENFVLKLLIAFLSFSFLTIILYLKIGNILKKKEGISCTIMKK